MRDVLMLIAWRVFTFSAESLATVLKVFLAILGLFTLPMIFSFIFLGRKPLDYLINVLILIIGFPAALIRLFVTDRIYLSRGSLKRLLRLTKRTDI